MIQHRKNPYIKSVYHIIPIKPKSSGEPGKRPVLVLTRQAVIGYLNKVTVVEITAQGKGYPAEVFIEDAA